MPDKFDEMAREIGHRCATQLRDYELDEIAAALRSTDAKAREDCARIAEKAYRTFTFDGRDDLYRILADQVEHIATAIREGADACGTTVPKEPDCLECWDSGEFPPHFHSPEDDCPNFIPSDVPGTDDLGSCGCELVRCACQGGDDAE